MRDLDHLDHPLGGEDVVAARAKLQYVFGPRADLLLSGDVTHQDPAPLTYAKVLAVKPGFEVNNPPGLHEVRASTLAWSRNLQYGAAARLTLRLAQDTTLTSLTAYRKLDYDVLVDTDVTELELTASHVHEIQHQWSEELTLARQRPGRSWVGGVFLFDDLDRQATSIRLGGPRLENRLDCEVGPTSAAVFGQATIGLTRRLSATAGLRYTRERKTIDNDGRLYTLDLPARWSRARPTPTPTRWRTTPGLRSSVSSGTPASERSRISRPRAGSRAAASTSRRPSPAVGSLPSGRGLTKAG